MNKETYINDHLADTFNGLNNFQQKVIEGRLYEALDLIDEDGNRYSDQYLVAGRLTVGREIATYEGQTITRSYEGGTIVLEELDITEGDVMKFLGSVIDGRETRLNKSITEEDGDWKYSYQPTGTHNIIPITTGVEEISYKGKVIFVHTFTILPLEA